MIIVVEIRLHRRLFTKTDGRSAKDRFKSQSPLKIAALYRAADPGAACDVSDPAHQLGPDRAALRTRTRSHRANAPAGGQPGDLPARPSPAGFQAALPPALKDPDQAAALGRQAGPRRACSDSPMTPSAARPRLAGPRLPTACRPPSRRCQRASDVTAGAGLRIQWLAAKGHPSLIGLCGQESSTCDFSCYF
jgi:hypothetical protein